MLGSQKVAFCPSLFERMGVFFGIFLQRGKAERVEHHEQNGNSSASRGKTE